MSIIEVQMIVDLPTWSLVRFKKKAVRLRWCWANDIANASKATVARNTSWIVFTLLLFRLPSEIFVRFSPFLIILSRSFVAYYNQVNDDSQFKPWFNFFLIRCFFFFFFFFFLNGYVEYKLVLRIQTNYNIYFVCFVQVLLFVFSLSERNTTKYVNWSSD